MNTLDLTAELLSELLSEEEANRILRYRDWQKSDNQWNKRWGTEELTKWGAVLTRRLVVLVAEKKTGEA